MHHNFSKLMWVFIPAVILGFLAFGLAQTPTAVITVEALSPQEIHNMGWNSRPSTGLKTVGMEELVYLSGSESSDSMITSYSWSFASVPTGSNLTALDSTNTEWTSFVPDTTGQFVVQLSITTAGGSHDTTVTITSAKWSGLGIITEPATLTGCACHPTNVTPYTSTGHATMFTEAIDGIKSDHYNEGCISCHVVGFDTLASNDGFDDRALALGWTWPDTLVGGNWDTIVAFYPDLAKVSNIQCENCHGAASLHKSTLSKDYIDVTIEEGVCGRCHEEEPYHRRPTQWKNSNHATGASFARGSSSSCKVCHSGTGFIEFVDNSIPWNPDDPGVVTCAVCHDPHSATQQYQIRILDDVMLNNGYVVSSGSFGKLCMNCHKSRRDAEEYATEYHSHYGPHHSNQTDMLFGTNAIEFGIPYIPSSPHKNLDKACVTCHMQPTPGTGMPGHDRMGDHTFAMNDAVDMVDNVAVCQPCHGSITTFEDIMAQEDHDGNGVIENIQTELSGLLDSLGVLLPPVGSVDVVVAPDYNALQLKAAYNYFYITDDGSHGVHNYQYAVALLKLAKRAMEYGVLSAGNILSIMDVPADQGKQVRMTWERFGGDGIGENPIQFYALWRRVDDPVAQNVKIRSLAEVNSDLLKSGTVVNVEEELWDFVGTVPAMANLQYTTVAPTLYDSTAAGMHYSVFMVSGHTAISTIYVTSAPDSGYSVDNLAPMAPMNLAGNIVSGNEVALTWDEPVDEDFSYFAVYRGDTPGFPATNPIATVTTNSYNDVNVVSGATYYYKLTATDFAGNFSDPSNEVSVLVTSVDGEFTGVPKDFVLRQNYPNPFNPSTTIHYGLPRQADVQIVVYDILGKQVRTLVSGQMSPGYHTVKWDGRDQNGNTVGGGIYIYQLKGESVDISNKMLLVK
jgi:hypothetical protein